MKVVYYWRKLTSFRLFLLLLLLTFEATRLMILKTDSKRARMLNVPMLLEPIIRKKQYMVIHFNNTCQKKGECHRMMFSDNWSFFFSWVGALVFPSHHYQVCKALGLLIFSPEYKMLVHPIWSKQAKYCLGYQFFAMFRFPQNPPGEGTR